jgi:hypothetical protein
VTSPNITQDPSGIAYFDDGDLHQDHPHRPRGRESGR